VLAANQLYQPLTLYLISDPSLKSSADDTSALGNPGYVFVPAFGNIPVVDPVVKLLAEH